MPKSPRRWTSLSKRSAIPDFNSREIHPTLLRSIAHVPGLKPSSKHLPQSLLKSFTLLLCNAHRRVNGLSFYLHIAQWSINISIRKDALSPNLFCESEYFLSFLVGFWLSPLVFAYLFTHCFQRSAGFPTSRQPYLLQAVQHKT
jgi:hypothetical protein